MTPTTPYESGFKPSGFPVRVEAMHIA